MMENYSLFAFLLLFFGIAILLSEVFIPSAGLLSFLALVCFIGSVVCAYYAWYVPDKLVWWWGYIFGIVFIIPGSIAGALYYLPRTSMGKELFAAPPAPEELTPFNQEEERLVQMINQVGHATTMFSPGGMAQIGRDKFHAEAEGVLVESGTEVVVVGVKGNRLLVRPTALHPVGDHSDEQAPESASESTSPGVPSEELAETLPVDVSRPLEEAVQSAKPSSEPMTASSSPAGGALTDSRLTSENDPNKPQSEIIDFDIPETT